MKTLKRLIFIVIILIAIPMVTALFVQKEYAVERQVNINQPKTFVFNYIKHLKNQENYSTWATMDPEMQRTYKGVDGSVGFVAAWDSHIKEVGKGEQEIMAIQEGERIDFELRFFKPFESTEPAYMLTKAINDSVTTVSWGFSGHMSYPMNLMFLFMNFEKMIGDDLQTGLNNLKAVLE